MICNIQASVVFACLKKRTSVGYGKTIEDAVSLRDRLLLFDRTSAERTRVYDDQADYYNSYEWLTDQVRGYDGFILSEVVVVYNLMMSRNLAEFI